ncbi:MAG: ABC transporter permease subunit [Pseudonocardiaceae bacterium]|nr:ABC transporter permease subunit [Pseudonocardiaceae bacterium]
MEVVGSEPKVDTEQANERPDFGAAQHVRRHGRMIRLIGRRVAAALFTLLLVSVIVFLISQVLPGDIGRTILGPYATAEQVARLNEQLGANDPLIARYGNWISSFVIGDWGSSHALSVAVRPLVLERFVNSLILGTYAFVIVVVISILLGVVAALGEGKLRDRAVSIAGFSLIAMPEFVSGTVLLVVFAVRLQWFPVVSTVPSLSPSDIVTQLTLPAVPVMLIMFGYISRMTREGTVDVLHTNYTRTAFLKGLPRRTVIRRHVLRNAMLPTVSVVMLQFGYMVGGLAVTEILFGYPGIGKLAVDSAAANDLPVLSACVLVIAAFYMTMNVIADVVYAALNPQIRASS